MFPLNDAILRSHVCWHVYGLIHRSERNYNEAIKAYKQALRIDSGNLQILRDLSLLQIQLRDLHGFALTRQTILNLKPNQMIHWLTFALSKHPKPVSFRNIVRNLVERKKADSLLLPTGLQSIA